MATSTITVAGLVATPGIGNIGFQWTFTDPNANGLPYMGLDAVELHAATTNDRSLATKVAEGRNSAQHMQVLEGVTYYYWIRARDKNTSPLYSDWYPSGSTSGVVGTVGRGAGLNALIRGKLVASVGSNALTVRVKTLSGDDPSAANPVYVNFPDSATGTATTLAITSAMSLVVPSGATMGATSGNPFRLWFLIVNHLGTLSLAVSNRSTIDTIYSLYAFNECLTFSLSSGSDSAGIIYETTGNLLSSPYRTAGYMTWESGLTTAGTWDAAPSVIQLYGIGIKLPGEVISSKKFYSYAVDVGTTNIPFDNTIPQNTEGDLLITGPTNATLEDYTSYANHIHADFIVNGANSNAASLRNAAALFRADSASAKAVAWGKQAAVNEPLQMVGTHNERVGLVASQAYTLRVGGETNGNTSFTTNGINAGTFFSTVLRSSLTLTEIMG